MNFSKVIFGGFLGNLNCMPRSEMLDSIETSCSASSTAESNFGPDHANPEVLPTVHAVRRIVSENDLVTDTAALGRIVKSVSFNDQVEQFSFTKADNPQDLWWSKQEREQMAKEARSENVSMRRSTSTDFNTLTPSGRATVQRSIMSLRRLETRLQVPLNQRVASKESVTDPSLLFNPRMLLNHAQFLKEGLTQSNFHLPEHGRWSNVAEVVTMLESIQTELKQLIE